MTVVVYSKRGCGVCESAKAKLALMGVHYDERDVEASLTLHGGWRGDGSVDLAAASAMLEGAVPLLRIDGEYLTYPAAMRRLKTEKTA